MTKGSRKEEKTSFRQNVIPAWGLKCILKCINEVIKVNTTVLLRVFLNHLCMLFSHLATPSLPVHQRKNLNVNDHNFHHFIHRNGSVRKMQVITTFSSKTLLTNLKIKIHLPLKKIMKACILKCDLLLEYPFKALRTFASIISTICLSFKTKAKKRLVLFKTVPSFFFIIILR